MQVFTGQTMSLDGGSKAEKSQKIKIPTQKPSETRNSSLHVAQRCESVINQSDPWVSVSESRTEGGRGSF